MTLMMNLPIPTIALVNGHFLAAGFMLAIAHDLIICVNNKKIKIGMTEIDLGLTIPRNMLAILEAKLSKRDNRDICLFGK